VAIAGALAESSRVLLLDELTTFLDETDQVPLIIPCSTKNSMSIATVIFRKFLNLMIFFN
jgi:ABC-type cobalamin/Fe3+-siderophores transport system ATPase subunit